ncbi:MAG: cytochrome c biogenesis protein ResB [Chloroflexota bacterium]|nr:MAG: cytochrome c biogenesis protein ResB [Chloroflexota bacterium]
MADDSNTRKPSGPGVMERTQGVKTSAVADAKARARPARQDDIADRAWRFFCSMRLALILILVITAAVFIGTLLDQAPGVLTASDYANWLSRERLKYGPYTDILSALQLFIIYNSAWFRGLLALLLMNIFICTVNRWNGIWTLITHPHIRMNESFFQKAGRRAEFTAQKSPGEAREEVVQALSKHRYRVLQEETAAGVHLYADKNRWFKLGTFLTHISFVVLLIGILLYVVFGFRETGFAIPEGSTRALGYGTNIDVRADAFADEYYPEGPPKDYRSDLVIFDNGREVARKTIHVNDPLEYNGVRFYQSFFGQAAIITVKDPQGQVLHSDGVALAWRSTRDEKRSVGSFDVPSKGLTVFVVGPRSGERDSLIPAGEVRLEIYPQNSQSPLAAENVAVGKSKTIGGLEYTFEREKQFTGLQVSKDPGNFFIWLASTLLVIGCMAVFYFPHRRLWILCHQDENGRTKVMVGAQKGRDLAFAGEFAQIKDDLAARLVPRGTR